MSFLAVKNVAKSSVTKFKLIFLGDVPFLVLNGDSVSTNGLVSSFS